MVLRGSVYSNILEMETGISVITPNDYGQAETYRVCYVLHGLCGGNADYSNYTMLPFYAYDKDVIFICPEVQRGFYENTAYGMRYFDYVATELPHLVKLVFNVSAKWEDTAIMGGSMGGYGALKCALTYPDHYGFCAAFSPAGTAMGAYLDTCRKSGQCNFPVFYNVFGKALHFDNSEDLTVMAARVAQSAVKPRVYMTTGNEDFLRDENLRFADDMKTLDIPFEFEELRGKHDLARFDQGIKRAIEKF